MSPKDFDDMLFKEYLTLQLTYRKKLQMLKEQREAAARGAGQ